MQNQINPFRLLGGVASEHFKWNAGAGVVAMHKDGAITDIGFISVRLSFEY